MSPFLCLLSILVFGGVVGAKNLLFEARGNKLCPDKRGDCPEGTTCCLLTSGSYGCCPLPDAVCCDDHEHCCPNGYICDVPAQQCDKGDGNTIPWYKKLDATPIIKKSGSVICPDQQSECPDGETCCQLSTGEYGCCPYPQAVCCSDHEHCCPHGYKCNLPQQTCDKGNGDAIPWSKKSVATPVVKSKVSIVCPDQQTECGDGETCCQLSSGQYGCCPLPQATCCSDHEHCCPHGYKCNIPAQTCDKENGDAIPWYKKSDATPIVKKSGSVICPDQQSECPDGQTCCRLTSGDYGCCPLPQATCCSDHEHCCPHGYKCNLPQQTCDKENGETIPWFKKFIASPIATKSVSVVCPDQQSECGDGQTCCQLTSGQYCCCPLPEAVCCDDHEHCCPHGYTCNVPAQTCNKGNGEAIPWYGKTSSTPVVQVPVTESPSDNRICSDQKSKCADGFTCCSNSVTGYRGCCPYENAVCCSDGMHCCPADTQCDVSSQMCQSNAIDMAISWNLLHKMMGSEFHSVEKTDVICPDQKSHCPSDTTCCQMQSGLYGCCPFREALCCEDKLHCCPKGHTCDVPHSACISESGVSLPWEMFGRKRAKMFI